MIAPPLHRFEEYGALSDAERAAVLALLGPPYAVARGHRIAIEGEQPTGFFLLLSGWASAFHLLPNGKRQIVKIHLPGDALGTPSMAMTQTTEGISAITDVVIAKVSSGDFGKLFDTHPRIIARFMLSIQQERIALMDRLVALGRTDAEARVAAFLLDLRERLEPLGVVHEDSFDLRMSQEQIADVLGLTQVHVNRVLATLEKRGLLKRDEKRYHLISLPGLSALAARPVRVRSIDQAWLPAPR